MGTDNLHHKNKKTARSKRSLARNAPTRQPKETILILCEGEITEPTYFNELKNEYRISSLTIQKSTGSAPITIVESAIKISKQNDAFDFIYCVFDKR